MTTEKKVIYVLAGILSGILLTVALIGSTSQAASANEKVAAKRLIEKYPETHILPEFALAIFFGESGGGKNDGRFYGLVASRRYPRTWDVVESTDQFLRLMKRYKNVSKQKTWIGQLYACQSHGFFGGSSSYYIRYITSVHDKHDFDKYNKLAKRHEKKLKRQKREKERKRRQKRPFTLIYDPTLAPWQVKTYKGVIKGGTIRIESDRLYGWCWLDVVGTKKGNKNIIYTGDREAIMHPKVKLAEILEEAVG